MLRSRVVFMSQFSCLTSLKSLFSPVTTDCRLFDCSTLNWSKSTRTPALHSVQMKVSEQHSWVEWSEEPDVMAAAAAETPSTEVLAASATEGVSVVRATATAETPSTEVLAASATEGVSVVRATAAAETPSTEVLAASATEGVSVVRATAALSLRLDLSREVGCVSDGSCRV